MVIAFGATLRNNMLDEINTLLNGGAGAALVRIYNGTRPATGGAATTLLAELTMTDPAAPAAAAGVLTMSAITDDSSANATGTASWFRAVDSTGAFVIDGDVAVSGSDMNIDNTSINITQVVSITSWTITAGNA